MLRALGWLGKQGRYCLIVGLCVGLAAPALAEFLRPWIGMMVALLLCVTSIRVGARSAFGNLQDLGPTLARIGVLQTALPLAVAGVLIAVGVADNVLSMAVVLLLAAPSLTGAPNFAIMIGRDPAPGMRLLVVGTALFPLTVLPVLLLLDPGDAGPLGALLLSVKLLAAILAAAGLGFALRAMAPGFGKPDARAALDGIATLLLAIVVVALMSAVGPVLRYAPMEVLHWLSVALAINVLLVLATLQISRRSCLQMGLATAIYAGNRNIALFLIALPEAVAAPLLVFVGCYQIPMYLTPVLLSRLQLKDTVN
ncbi:MAG: hypothetical protein AAFY52_00875 [Pseudomonadota bacterium]